MAFNPCDKCGQDVVTEFLVDNHVWSLVTGQQGEDGEYAEGYWCVPCFVRVAEAMPDMEFSMQLFTRRDYYGKAADDE